MNKNNIHICGNEQSSDTLIFGHGFGTDQTAWKAIVPAFEQSYKIVLYDNVGAGNSDPESFSPNKYDNLGSYAGDLIDICNESGLRNVTVVAHSVSGMISLLASIKQPGIFSKMILIGASPRYLNDDNYVGGFDQATLNAFYDQMANNYFAWVSGFAPAAMANADRPSLAQSFAQSLASIRPDIAQSVARVIFQSDHRKELSRVVNKQVLLLQTKNDIAVPMEVAQYLNENIEGSTLEVLDAEGHFPHISAPEAVVAAIKNFI